MTKLLANLISASERLIHTDKALRNHPRYLQIRQSRWHELNDAWDAAMDYVLDHNIPESSPLGRAIAIGLELL